MFTRSFFQDIRNIITDVMLGSEKVYILRQQLYDADTDTMTNQSPVGAAVPAVISQVSEGLVDDERILKTDMGIVVPASLIAFQPKAGDMVYLGDDATADESFSILHVGVTRSPTVKMLYELVVRL